MKQLLPLVSLLVLAGCHNASRAPVVAAPPPYGLARGIDLPTDARDVSLELKDSHLDFVARYYRDPASRWPALSAAEARSVSAAGMQLVALWEWHSHDPAYFSYATGYWDAMKAYREALAVGQPAGSAIYFAVDFNAQAAQIAGPVDQYFRGIAAGLAATGEPSQAYRIGVYGSGAVCDYLKSARLAQYAWLSNSTAWAGYGSFSNWNIRQGGRAPAMSFSQDANEARDEYGGFRVGAQFTSLSP
jgi:hypothetical protein